MRSIFGRDVGASGTATSVRRAARVSADRGDLGHDHDRCADGHPVRAGHRIPFVSRRLAATFGLLRVTGMTNHVVVVGLGSLGVAVVERLVAMGQQVVVVERDPNNATSAGRGPWQCRSSPKTRPRRQTLAAKHAGCRRGGGLDVRRVRQP